MKNQTPLDVVKQIHSEVLTASEKCIITANEILKKATENNIETYTKLLKLGFKNTKEVVENELLIQDIVKSKKEAEIISNYSFKYPLNKFISLERMSEICDKYNLILGPNQYYNNHIPQRAINEIVNFKLNKDDEIYYEGCFKSNKIGIEKSEGTIEWFEITEQEYNKKTDFGKKTIINDGFRDQKHYTSNKDYFIIAAPLNMFNTEEMVVEDGVLKKKIEVYDPVCLKVVKHGFIIVSVWGEEMAIEAMKNEKLN